MVSTAALLVVAAVALATVDAGVLPRYRNGYTPPVRVGGCRAAGNPCAL